jgi:hypothetical protein
VRADFYFRAKISKFSQIRLANSHRAPPIGGTNRW